MDKIRKKLVIYTDGACSGNPGPGGWGFCIFYPNEEIPISEKYGYELNTTNNRMEMTAAIEALQSLTESCDVQIYTDSNYLKQGITLWIKNWLKNNWLTSDKKQVKNIDLWQKIYYFLGKHNIEWAWVKAHNNDPKNERADYLACQGKEIAIASIKQKN